MSFSPDRLSVRLTVDAPDDLAGAERARALALEAIGKVTSPGRILRLEAVDADELERENALPNFPDIVGSNEADEILGVSRQRLHELRAAGRFPDPLVELSATPIWLRPTIEAWLERWDRRPGRPAKQVEPDAGSGAGFEELLAGGKHPETAS